MPKIKITLKSKDLRWHQSNMIHTLVILKSKGWNTLTFRLRAIQRKSDILHYVAQNAQNQNYAQVKRFEIAWKQYVLLGFSLECQNRLVKAKDIKVKGSLFIFKEENSHQNVPYIIKMSDSWQYKDTHENIYEVCDKYCPDDFWANPLQNLVLVLAIA